MAEIFDRRGLDNMIEIPALSSELVACSLSQNPKYAIGNDEGVLFSSRMIL